MADVCHCSCHFPILPPVSASESCIAQVTGMALSKHFALKRHENCRCWTLADLAVRKLRTARSATGSRCRPQGHLSPHCIWTCATSRAAAHHHPQPSAVGTGALQKLIKFPHPHLICSSSSQCSALPPQTEEQRERGGSVII